MNLLALGIVLILIFPILIGVSIFFDELDIEFKEIEVGGLLSIIIGSYAAICGVAGIVLIIIANK